MTGEIPCTNDSRESQKAQRAQLIIGIIALIGIFLPGILFWLIKS